MTEQAPDPNLQEALLASERRVRDLRARLEATQGFLDAISEAICIQDADGWFLEVNEGAARMYGFPKAFFIGKSWEHLAAPGHDDGEAVTRAFSLALGGSPQQFIHWGQRRDRSVFPMEVRLYPGTYQGRTAVIAIAQDISDRERAAQVKEAAFRVAETALRAQDLPSLYRSVHDVLRTLLPAENCYIALHDADTDTLSWPYWVDQVDEVPRPQRFGRGLTEFVIRTGQPQLLDEEKLASLVAAGEARFMGSESLAWMGVPLRNDHRVFGALVIQSYEGGYRYQPEDLEILSFVSAQVAMAIDRRTFEERLRFISVAMEGSRDSFFWIREDGGIEFVNGAACSGLGYTLEEFRALSVSDIDPSISPESWKITWESVRKGIANIRETSQRRKDGTFRPVEVSRTMLRIDGRELLFVAVRDITERKEVEAALLASEEKFSSVFRASPDAININRLDGTYVEVNEAFTRMSGWSREETLGRTTLELGLWADLSSRAHMQELLKADGRFIGLEASFRMKDGSLRTGLVSGTLIPVDGETCLLTITRDITERKAAEMAIRASEDKFHRAFHASPDSINITRLQDGVYLDVNEGFERMSGWSRAETLGRSSLELNLWVEPADRERMTALVREQGDFSDQEFRFRLKDGRIMDGLMSGKILDMGGVPCLLTVTRDITAQKANELALRSVEQRLRTVLANSQAIIYQLDPEGRFLLSEGLGLAALGLTPGQMVGFNALEVYQEDSELLAQLKRGLSGEASRLVIPAAGRLFDHFLTPVLDGQGRLESLIGIATDVTERQQMEEALRQSQKLESLGILAGGIAHDFNNLLTVILGNLNLAQMHLPEHAPAQPYLGKMETTVLRATELTKQMLAYSGRGHFLVKPHHLNEIVQEVTHLLAVSISKKVKLLFDLDPALPAIQADAAQIQQVVMNLVTNASEAIGDRDGVIRLTTTTAHLEARELASAYHAESLPPGRYVLLEISDSGMGMSPEVLARIFDPFFTTKAAGRGLGLSAMLGILRGHGAGLQITSEQGRGSCFRICFPATDDPCEAPAPVPEASPAQALRGRVLLVDDEEQVLQTIGSALQMLGLEVVTARDGLEALECFRDALPRPNLVLMDLTMPRMDGREAFRAMHDLDPSVPVLLSSGYTEQDSLMTLSGLGPAGFVQKPYQIRDLRTLLQRVLGG